MLSRRKFIVGSAGALAFVAELLRPETALARRGKKKKLVTGPHSLSRQAWPPAISPDFVAVVKKGYLALADSLGRLSIVDLRKAGDPRHPPEVVAEFTGLGKRVRSLAVSGSKIFLIGEDSNTSGDTSFSLTVIEARRPTEPYVASKIPLESFQEASVITANRKLVVVAGRDKSNKNLVAVLQLDRSGKQASILSTVTTQLPVEALSYQRKKLVILGTGHEASRIDFLDLASPSAPRAAGTLELKGTYSSLASYKDLIVVAGKQANSETCEAKTISLRPAPHVVASAGLDPLSTVLSAIVQKKRYMVMGQSEGKLTLLDVSIDKHLNLIHARKIDTGPSRSVGVKKASLVEHKRKLYMATGWSGVHVLSERGGIWTKRYTYTIPRLAASGIATWGSSAVVVGGELIRYDISSPDEPRIDSRIKVASPIKSMVGAGSFVLCLTRDKLLLMKMDNLDNVVSRKDVTGKSVAFDKTQHRAYVIKPLGKLTRVYPFKVYSDSLDAQAAIDLPGNFTSLRVLNGTMLVSDYNVISLVKIGARVKQVGKHKFEKLAIRDTWLTDNHILATAVDKQSKGFLLILSREDEGLTVKGSVDLPHNGIALTADGDLVATIGKDTKGKDLVSIVDVSNPVAPNVKTSLKVLESASAITIRKRIAMVAGRGLELVDLG